MIGEIRKKTFESRDPSRITSMRNLSASALFEKTMDDVTVDLLQRFLFFLKKEKEKIYVCVVSLDGIICKAFLGYQVMEKEFFCRNKLMWKRFVDDGKLE